MNYRNMTNDELRQVVDDLDGHVRPEYVRELATRLEAAEAALDAARADVAEAEEEAASVECDANYFRDLVADTLPMLRMLRNDHGEAFAGRLIERAEARL